MFLVCYSVTDRDSFESIEAFWISEIRKHCKKTPIILVATETEKKIVDHDVVSKQEGLVIMDKYGVYSYNECTSSNKDHVNDLFEEALMSVVKNRKRRRSSILRQLISR